MLLAGKHFHVLHMLPRTAWREGLKRALLQNDETVKLLQNGCPRCKDVSLRKAPSDWLNKESNGQ